MKGKKILALVSIFAGVALVGTTFAASAWAVTDNAGTKTIKISGGKISTDTGTSYVTLEYGSSTNLNDVANLASGTKRYAGCVGLVATYTGESSYNGLLTLRMSQAARESERLIDYVKVTAYDAAPTYDGSSKVVSAVSGNKLAELDGTASTPVLVDTKSIAMTNTEKLVYFVVEMVDDENLDATILNAIRTDVINVTVDWDHDEDGQDVASVVKVYYKPTGVKNDEVYCYAWKGKVPNEEYPGIKMTKESDGVYSYAINSANFDHFILSYTGTDDQNHKAKSTDDGNFALSEVTGTNNYWNGTQWTTRPEADPTLTEDYYLVGDMAASSWACKAAYALTEDSSEKDDQNENTYKIENVDLAKDQKIKIRNNSNRAGEEWYSNVTVWGDLFTIDVEGNVVISAAGKYDIRLYKNSNQNNHIVLSVHGS